MSSISSIGSARATSLKEVTRSISRSLARLSSGKRAPTPRDGMMPYALSVKMQSRIRGLTQGLLNLNQAQGVLSTTVSALESQLDIVNKMREIALEATNGALTSTERQNLNHALEAVLKEFNQIAQSSEFAGERLLNGSARTKTFNLGNSSTDSLTIDLPNTTAREIFSREVGTGKFEVVSTFYTSSPRGVRIGDFNNDGHKDAISLEAGTDSFVVWMNNGAGSYTRSFTSELGLEFGQGFGVSDLGDINGDGNLDILVGQAGGTIGLYTGNGEGEFEYDSTSGLDVADLRLNDMNNDGHLDIAYISWSGEIGLLLNNGDGEFSDPVTVSGANPYASLQVADTNGDGSDEIIYFDGAGDIYRADFVNNALQSQVIGTSSNAIDKLLVGDFNGDDIADVLVGDAANSVAEVLIGRANGTLASASVLNSFILYYDSTIADVNSDGIDDILTANTDNNTVDIRLNTGGGVGFSLSSITSSSFTAVWDIDAQDMNDDGVIDIIIADRGGDQMLVLNAITGNRSAVSELSVLNTADAEATLNLIDTALEKVTNEIANLAQYQNRLDLIASSNLLMTETLESARANIEDVDFAIEVAELTRNQILQQANIAAIAQENISRQAVLALLSNL